MSLVDIVYYYYYYSFIQFESHHPAASHDTILEWNVTWNLIRHHSNLLSSLHVVRASHCGSGCCCGQRCERHQSTTHKIHYHPLHLLHRVPIITLRRRRTQHGENDNDQHNFVDDVADSLEIWVELVHFSSSEKAVTLLLFQLACKKGNHLFYCDDDDDNDNCVTFQHWQSKDEKFISCYTKCVSYNLCYYTSNPRFNWFFVTNPSSVQIKQEKY